MADFFWATWCVWSDRAAAWHLSLALDSKFPIEDRRGSQVRDHVPCSLVRMEVMDGWGIIEYAPVRIWYGTMGAWSSEGISLRIYNGLVRGTWRLLAVE